MSKIKVFELEDASDNLCNYCDCNYPDCVSRVKFSDGESDDNIIGCNVFQGETEDTFIQEKEITEEEFKLTYED